MRGNILMALITKFTYYEVHMTGDIFKVIGSKIKVTGNIFRKALFWQRHTDGSPMSPLKTI